MTFGILRSIASSSGEWVSHFLDLKDEGNISTLDGVTYDTFIGWMKEGMTRYMDSLQTTLPDLTTFHGNGGKIIHFHGEQDSSIPTGSSVHYYDSVRQTMYPGKSYNASYTRWVEQGIVPHTLNATVLQGDNKGTNEQLCAWPLRPYWKGSEKTLTCEYDQASIDTFTYVFDAYKTPLY
ncbi:hypothetical protein N7449_011285 [Penicillium cf. viridicatum]|uniref:Carboxylic ester hydrolase n=1 Tax=Penicillium cf. viridicatum TaxID=2972119 RepID=A0A9W9M1W2_9EURO|nr:hypothetical protein N7449_011285 [Penicillium cf. viridicatum]